MLTSEMFGGLFARGAVAREVDDRAWLGAMLDFEAALAEASAEAGLVPAAVAAEIATACAGGRDLDLARLGQGSAASGTPVPALVAALGERLSQQGRAHLHRGATSQDVVDSAAMLLSRRALAPLLEDLEGAAEACAQLVERHSETLAVGRTLLQQALPITFGLKAAGWLVGLDEAAAWLAQVRERTLAVQLGGAAGTLASLGDHGVEIAAGVARRLELAAPTLPWQSQRLRPVQLAAALGASAGVAGKIATDVVLLAQTEVAEVAEAGSGGSSTLPQKRNPVAAVAARACAERTPGLVASMFAAMGGEHERAAGAWQAESELLSELLRLSGSAVAAVRLLLEGLEVYPERMRENLEQTRGLVMAEALTTALSASLGRADAHELVQSASTRALQEGRTLRELALATPKIEQLLGTEGVERALDPTGYLGSSSEFLQRALTAHRARGKRSS